MNFPRIGTYSSLRGDGSPLAGHPERIDALARYDRVIIELGTLNLYPQIVADLRRLNPTIHLDAYVVMSWWTSGIPFFKEFCDIVHATNGVCVTTTGKAWSFTNVNLARWETAKGLADLIVRHAQGWNGIFADILIPKLLSVSQSNGAEILDWRSMGWQSEALFLADWEGNALGFMERLKLSGLPVSSNYGNSFPFANGKMVEAFPLQNGGTWEANMVKNQWNQPGLLNLTYAEPRACWIISSPHRGPNGYDPRDPENLRMQRFHDASACLSGDYGSFSRFEWDEAWKQSRHLFFAPHYVHPQRGKGWLGEPLGVAVHITEQKGKPVDLWRRFFERGVVVVNPSSKPHSIYFSEQYRPIGGVAKSAWSIPAHDGLLLEAV